MRAPHVRAVQLAFIIRDKTTNPAISAIVYDIISTQQQRLVKCTVGSNNGVYLGRAHRRRCHGCLLTSNRQRTRRSGNARDSNDVAAAVCRRPAADRRFLTLMIDYHRGGIAMAEATQSLTGITAANTLATATLQPAPG